MEKAKHFEDLWVWQQARILVKKIYEDFREGPGSRDFGFRDQIQKAGISIMNNIAEGFDDGSTREFIRFLGYSQRSCSEVQSQLYRALDCNYITKKQFNSSYGIASDCRKQIKGFRKYLRNFDSKEQK